MPFTVYKTVYKTQEDKGQPLPWGGGTVRRLQNGNTQDGMLAASGPESASILLPFSGNLQKDAAPKRGTWDLGEEGTAQEQLQPMQRKMGEERWGIQSHLGDLGPAE